MSACSWYVATEMIDLVIISPCIAVSVEAEQQHFDAFFEDVFVECEDRYGPIEEMNICDNLGDHLVGNVYIKVAKLHVQWAIRT